MGKSFEERKAAKKKWPYVLTDKEGNGVELPDGSKIKEITDDDEKTVQRILDLTILSNSCSGPIDNIEEVLQVNNIAPTWMIGEEPKGEDIEDLPDRWTSLEANVLFFLEGAINKSLRFTVLMALMLLFVKTRQLYRFGQHYTNIQKYARDRFTIGKSRTYQLLTAGRIYSNLALVIERQYLPDRVATLLALKEFTTSEAIKYYKAALTTVGERKGKQIIPTATDIRTALIGSSYEKKKKKEAKQKKDYDESSIGQWMKEFGESSKTMTRVVLNLKNIIEDKEEGAKDTSTYSDELGTIKTKLQELMDTVVALIGDTPSN